MRFSLKSSKSGYSLAELLIAISIIGILTAVAVPRFGKVRDRAALANSTTRVTRALFAARQSAIQRGNHAYFRHSNSVIWVIVDTSGNMSQDSIIITPQTDLTANYGVQITAPTGVTTIEYDPRGVSPQASAKVFRFTHLASGMQDSLCVSKLGNTIRAKCP